MDYEKLDRTAREAWHGDYTYVVPLSIGELRHVALASGRMRELAPDYSIPYAVDRIGYEAMAHMLTMWRSDYQPRH